MRASLKQKLLVAPTLFVLALLIVLSLIISLGQFFHQSLQEEMADQFNREQLLLAREVAINMQSVLDNVINDITIIAQLPEIQSIQGSSRCRVVAEAIIARAQSSILLGVKVLNRDGRVLFDSTAPGRLGENLSQTDYFLKTKKLRRGEKYITNLMDAHHPPDGTKEFIIATPIYQELEQFTAPRYNGMVIAVMSLDAITKQYLSPIKSGSRGYVWLMDSTGTLLYHPNQPQMVGRNLYHTDKSCFRCHVSFDTEKKMIEGKAETFGSYQAPGGENKLMAFYRIPLDKRSWVVVVSAPYSDVIALMQKSRRFYSLLIVSIFITTITASGTTIITYKKKIKAEEKAKHLENQRRLEREIEIAKNYLENIVESTRTNLMVLDRNFTVRTVNTAQAVTLRRSKEDILNRSFFSLFAEPLRFYEGIPIEAIFQKTLSGKSFEIQNYKVTGIQPEPIYLDLNISPLLIGGGVTGIIITSSNVTRRVQLEEALKRYTVELEDKVDQETATKQKLEQQVLHSEKLAALGRLAAGVAHEIGNPLTSISTFAQLLREMATDEFSKSSLDTINTHIQRITEIVRQMSTFSRPDSLNIKEVQLSDILQSSLDLMRLDKRMKSTITIDVHLEPDLPKIMIDEGQIAQVFINIILNALDAMPDGGTLTLNTRRGTDARGRDAIFIDLRDTGVGIPAADLEKIFDPFYTTKEAGKGTGLGLSVSYNIVKRFRGDIKVASELGKGTTFTIMLPVEQNPERKEQA